MKIFENPPAFWPDRLKASAIHFAFSAALALLAGLLVFAVWYPFPYREISGGRELFVLVVGVDVVLGPLATLAIFDRRKAWPVLRRDIQVIGLLQLLALGYGLWTVFAARPVHMVFEYDRFRVVHAIEIDAEQLQKAAPAVRAMPMTGPTLLALRPFADERERMEMTVVALNGLPLGMRPELWIPYDETRARVLLEAKPVSALISRLGAKGLVVEQAIRDAGHTPQTLVYLPLLSRKLFWTVLLDPTNAQIVTAVPVDPY